MHYPFHTVEPRWQQYWDENATFRTGTDTSRPKFYILDMFPYPSGAGLHVGHPEGYTATDIVSRYKRMRGFNVLHPMGWDAFGLPAEQYAVKEGKHPADTTRENIDTFRRQLKRIGFSYDWEREVCTTDPAYYKWTQWIFMQLYRQGLAYVADVPVNWCPELATILANEEVPEQVEKGYTVVRRPMRQWMLRITAYAERLLADLDELDWSESLKEMQRNWIGRSEGAEVDFHVDGSGEPIRVFTTRPDTLWGATYMVLAPEHPLVAAVTTPSEIAAIEAYIDAAARKSDMERTELAKDKTGVFTGAYAINPVNGGRIPIWIADYVLASYGTGAIMAVPAHDSRDWEFARKFGLPIIEVVAGGNVEEAAFTDTANGTAVNSGFITGLPSQEAIERVTVWLEERGLGKRTVNYKLRDWLFSRQRYWGEPFPVIYREDGTHTLIPEDQLPLTLPDVENYRPSETGESPLARATAWLATTDPETGRPARRETNTMPQWAGSCWYYLRFMDPHNDAAFCGAEAERYWGSIDLYVGGAEHAVLHLLYARFWHKVLYDLGYVTTKEPFLRLVNQGLILGEMEYTGFRNAAGEWVSSAEINPDQPAAHGVTRVALGEDEVTKVGTSFVLKDHPAVAVHARAYKMSKSRGNVINPDHVIEEHGADSLRLFEMFMGPLEMVKPWSTKGVDGVHRFLDRVWRLFVQDAPAGDTSAGDTSAGDTSAGDTPGDDTPRLDGSITASDAPDDLRRMLHKTIKKVTEDIEALRFNTAISQLMIFVNELNKRADRPRSVMEPFVLLLSPFAPHIAEELWRLLGHVDTLARESWPVYDEAYTADREVEILLQVNGKLRDKILAATGTPADTLEAMARSSERVRSFIEGKTVVKVITVPDKLVNIVVR